LGIYLDALKRRSISYGVEENKYFYSTQEIIDLVNLLKTILNPDDKIPLVGVLRSPLAGFNDLEIFKFRQASLLDYRKNPDDKFKELKNFYLKLRQIKDIFGRTSLSRFINITMKKMRVFEILPFACNGEQTASNIFKFISIVNGLEQLSCESLNEYLNPSKDFTGTAGEGENPLTDESLDAVNIMTLHKSKGLEFPVVIVADISADNKPKYTKNEFMFDWYTNTAGFGVSSFGDIALADLQEKERKHSRSEEIRNFYVALTRARDKLILVGNNQKPADGTIAGYIDKSLSLPKIDGDYADIKIENLKFPVRVSYFGKSSALHKTRTKAKVADTACDARKWYLDWQKRTDEFNRLCGLSLFTSATSIGMEAAGKAAKTFSEEGRQYASLLGTLCHKVLQVHDFKQKFDLEKIEKTLHALTFNICKGVDLDKLSRQAFTILDAFEQSEEYKKIAYSEIIARELPFDYIYKENGITCVMRGLIDLVIKTEDKICIIDYKSENLVAGSEQSRAVEFKTQCEIYRNFISKMFPDLPVYSKVLFIRTAKSVEF
jgi:ATP-dependent helicase/nuclease subunit A